MDEKGLIPSGSHYELEVYKNGFQVPVSWRARAIAYYISGAPGIAAQQLAVALTPEEICLCGAGGVLWSLHLSEISDVRPVDLRGIHIVIPTSTTLRGRLPVSSWGVEVSFNQSVWGMSGRLVWHVRTANEARMWENKIRELIDLYHQGGQGDATDTETR